MRDKRENKKNDNKTLIMIYLIVLKRARQDKFTNMKEGHKRWLTCGIFFVQRLRVDSSLNDMCGLS
jgi:hypothetical protein